jgi:hypothetical protein
MPDQGKRVPSEAAVEAIRRSQGHGLVGKQIRALETAEPIIRAAALEDFKQALLFELKFELEPYTVLEIQAALDHLAAQEGGSDGK